MADSYVSIQGALTALGERARRLRLLRDIKQEDLARDAGVGVKALRRFEATGQGAMETALRVAVALSAEEAFGALFAAAPVASLDELEQRDASRTRRRARRRT